MHRFGSGVETDLGQRQRIACACYRKNHPLAGRSHKRGWTRLEDHNPEDTYGIDEGKTVIPSRIPIHHRRDGPHFCVGRGGIVERGTHSL